MMRTVVAATLLACLISAAAALKSPARAQTCGSQTHPALAAFCDRLAEARGSGEAAVVYDFENSRIPAKDLADLIAAWSPDVSQVLNTLVRENAPAKLLQELTVRNAIVYGRFSLRNADIGTALHFENAAFVTREEDASSPDCPPVRADEEPRTVFLLRDVRLEKRLILADSRVCGRLLIKDSRLEGGLTLTGRTFDWNRPPEAQTTGLATINTIYVEGSSFGSSVVLQSLRVPGTAEFLRNDSGVFQPLNLHHEGTFELSNNSLSTMMLWHATYGDGMVVQSNTFDGAARLYVLRFLSDTRIPRIKENTIKGGLEITLRDVTAERIDASHNSAVSSSTIWFPPDWRGSADLAGSEFAGVLKLFIAEYDAGKNELVPIYEKIREPRSAYCPPTHPTQRNVIVIMSLARISNLAWHLPFTCDYRWRGIGLTYAYWGDRDDTRLLNETTPMPPSDEGSAPMAAEAAALSLAAGSAEDLIVEDLSSWRFQMDEADTAALRYLRDYLALHGKLTGSKDIARELGQLNFVGSESLYEPGILRTILSGSLPAYLLAPVGYGANPEWALIAITALWLFGWAVYRTYSFLQKDRWRNAAVTPGYSRTPGFRQFDVGRQPRRFSMLQYSFDATLPVISLHTYDAYYPDRIWMRWVPVLQHVFGWYFITMFLVSAAVL